MPIELVINLPVVNLNLLQETYQKCILEGKNGTVVFEEYKTLEPVGNVAVGGTFDHLHAGHKLLLSVAALHSSKLLIGLNSNIESKKRRELVESLQTRKEKLIDFLLKFNPHIHFEIVEINDLFGPTANRDDLDILVVSEETLKGGDLGI